MELCLQGPSQGNPFMEQSVTAVFRCSNEEVTVSGFYDGDGVYRVRFMPSFQGTYSFTVTSTSSQPLEGTFQVTPATGQNHGMVRVANTWASGLRGRHTLLLRGHHLLCVALAG